MAHIAGDLRAVHAQPPGLDLEGDGLLIRDLRESLLKQANAGGAFMRAETAAEIVHGAQLEVAVTQILVADRVAHLQVVQKGSYSSSSLQAKPTLSDSRLTSTFIGVLGREAAWLYSTANGRSSSRANTSRRKVPAKSLPAVRVDGLAGDRDR